MTTTEFFVHTLTTGKSRNDMIREISETVDEGVLVDGWEDLNNEELMELYSVLLEDAE